MFLLIYSSCHLSVDASVVWNSVHFLRNALPQSIDVIEWYDSVFGSYQCPISSRDLERQALARFH